MTFTFEAFTVTTWRRTDGGEWIWKVTSAVVETFFRERWDAPVDVLAARGREALAQAVACSLR